MEAEKINSSLTPRVSPPVLRKAGAVKTGRFRRLPYVATITYPNPAALTGKRVEHIKGLAWATRDEAVAYAQKCIDRLERKDVAIAKAIASSDRPEA